ncbi:PucR family transcriptional regulator [Microbispora rosea subsp. aerata]|nr:PucR family transcriptional regulator [Microbispora rosea]GGO24001.1 PucR family transcriptional regulator [Microbispora rosea subsp. aerata]GIH57869.1 PucR family transcriptional regulator [Microbispora rosea subsp. aerata]GLJ86081.1 PucR family transcriptional regulator [Microbispora rosea subsp. aerata]
MAPTLRRITAIVPLHLEVLAGRSGLDQPVRWVAVSELEDPTPFLEGGELVLTTGMRLTAEDAVPYVSRLVARGVTGLGFGVGLTHDEVPPAFAEAAEAAGLPLLEVPKDTPFIAIGKAVSELLAGEQYEEIKRAFAAQGRLTRAALQREGTAAVVDRLAREIGGWALLLDPAGAVRHAADATGRRAGPRDGHGAAGGRAVEAGRGEGAPPGGSAAGSPEAGTAGDWAEETARSLEPEIGRLRGAPSLSSLALATPDEHVVVQPLGRRGFFAVGSPRPFSPIAHTVVNAAGSLLTLALEQGREQRSAAAQVRGAVLRLLLAGEARAAVRTLAALGMRLPGEPVTVLACDTSDPEALAEALAGAAPASFTAPWEGLLVVLAPDSRADEAVALAARHGRVGVSAPGVEIALFAGCADPRTGARQGASPEAGAREPRPEPAAGLGGASERFFERASGQALAAALDRALDQARRALVSASPVARFGELAGRGLLSLLDPAAASFAAAILAPLRQYGSRADLVESLRAYLASNGHWDAAAQRLGVHRHTLRYRMKRVSELLGRDLDDPAVRAELWIALCL